MAQVPKHEEFTTGCGRRGNMAKQVDMGIPETLLKTEYHLQRGDDEFLLRPSLSPSPSLFFPPSPSPSPPSPSLPPLYLVQ